MKTQIKLNVPLGTPRRAPASRLRRLVHALALAGMAGPGLGLLAPAVMAQALPTGAAVVRGTATVVQSGNQMTVTNSPGAVLNWQSFNIGAGHTVRFDQADAASKVLNRVVGANPSQIFGHLSSNGQVWLVNPYGVLFGSTARVDVASLVVSTLNIGADDWRAGRFSLSGGAEAGSLVNQGELRSTTGGRIFLLGGAAGVRNEGLIATPDGQVALAAGASIDLADGQTRNLAVRVQAPQGQVLNLGSIVASGGRVDLAAAMVNQQGIVRADALGGQGGEVVLTGSHGVDLAAGSVTSASGDRGGSIGVDGGGGKAMVAGTLDLTGHDGAGGDALLLGRNVGLLDGALVDASGTAGGGRIRVGGGLQGRDASVNNAEAVYMALGASLRADATRLGTGGTIILWGDKATRAYGTLSARGGAEGGDGGFIETSGGWLDARPLSVRTTAAKGKAGVWLLDPNDILITGDTNDTGVTGGPDFTTTGDSARINDLTIVDALNAGNNVTITTAAAGANSEDGNITVSGAFISANPNRAVSLTLNAAQDISMSNSTIETLGSPLSVNFNAANNGTKGQISIFSSRIATGGGNVLLGGGGLAVGPNLTSPRRGAVGYTVDGEPAAGVRLTSAQIDAGTGNITVVGSVGADGAGGYGVQVTEVGFANFGSSLRGNDIELWGWVDNNNFGERTGVVVTGSRTLIQARHSLTLTGLANSSVYRSNPEVLVAPMGVMVSEGTLVVDPGQTDATASLRIDGTVRDAAFAGPDFGDARLAVRIGGGLPQVVVRGGATATIVGQDNVDPSATSAAVQVEFGATLDFAGAGAATIGGNRRINYVGSTTAGAALTMSAGTALDFSGTVVGDPATIALNGQDVLLDFAGIFVGGEVPTAITVTATRDIVLRSTSIQSAGSPINVTLTAAASNSGAGTVVIEDSNVLSGGGDITIGGGSTAVGPNLSSPRVGAVATGGGAGVSIVNSGLDARGGQADGGAISITGLSVGPSVLTENVTDATGVLITGFGEGFSQIRGRNIDIFGWVDSNAPISRTGVALVGDSLIESTNAVGIFGLANSSVYQLPGTGPVGVLIDADIRFPAPAVIGPQLRPVGPEASLAPADALTITGTVNDGAAVGQPSPRHGVLVDSNASIFIETNPRVTITGTDQSANNEVSVRLAGLVMDFTSATDVSITGNRRVEIAGQLTPGSGALTVRAGTTLTLESVDIFGGPSSALFRGDTALLATGSINFESPTPLTLQSQRLTLGGTNALLTLVSEGPVRLLTDNFESNLASISAGGVGTTIAIAGYDGQSNVTTFIAPDGMPNLDPGRGRWLIYARTDNVPEGTLNFAFRQYNTPYPNEPEPAAGNGLVYSLAPVLTLSNSTPITKVYDGTTAVTTGNIAYSLNGVLPGHQYEGLGPVTASYTAAGVVTGQALGVAGYQQPSFTDANQRPVYGYTTQFAVTGDITPRPLALAGVTAADKAYDGTRTASLGGGVLGNLVAGETLVLGFANAQFDTASAGNGKAVTGTVSLLDGTGAASNYVLANGNAVAATANVTPRQLTLAGVTAAGKVYDGTRTATLAGGALGNLVAGETLNLLLAGGQFDTANVGNGKVVNGTASVTDGTGLASNYTLGAAAAVSLTASITPRTLTVAGVTAASRVYDGSRAAGLAGGALVNLVAGETLLLSLGAGQFDTANAGVGKAVTGQAFIADGTGLASNYQLAAGGNVATTADITPRPLTLASVQATSRVYDGTRNATVTGGSLSGLVEGESLALSFSNSQFQTAGVGTNKAITTTATLLNGNNGLAANYSLLPANGAVASNAAITPAPLQYVATPVTLSASQLGAALVGTVTGFVAGETLASATTGTLSFTSPATAASPPGTYAIEGSGLAAANYVFSQAAGNATALTLRSLVPETVGLPEVDDNLRVFRQALPPLPPAPESVRTLDALQSLRVDATWLSMSFGELDLDALSREEIAALLEARRQYKASVLRVGRDRLESDPSLADVPACQTVKQAESGRCLVTAELLDAVEARGESASIDVPPPAPRPAPPAAAAPAAPTAVPAAPPVAAPVPVATPAVPAASALPAVPAVVPAPVAAVPAAAPTTATTAAVASAEPRTPPRLRVAAKPTTLAPPMPAARAVRSASVPQIQRKIAVLIGVDNYVDERIPALENANRDVDAVARILEQRLGYETVIVRDAGREAMVGVLNKLALQVKPSDSVVVYYAGHGTVIDGTAQGYWIPATADAERPETWLANRDIAKLLGGIRASQVVLISDSCFSGSLVSDRRLRTAATNDARTLLQRRATLVMSSGGDEPVADGARGGHSPFSNALMGTLQGLDNWRPGGNVFERVREDVTRRLPQTPRYGPARDARHVDGSDYVFEQRELGAR